MTDRHNKTTLLADLKDLASRAYDAKVTVSTQRAIDYAVAELEAESEPSRPSQPPGATLNAQVREGANARFKKAREILRGIR